MSDNRKRTSTWIIGGILLPVLYVASAGPFLWLGNHGYIPQSLGVAFQGYFAPLIYVHDHSDTAKVMIEWYLELWI